MLRTLWRGFPQMQKSCSQGQKGRNFLRLNWMERMYIRQRMLSTWQQPTGASCFFSSVSYVDRTSLVVVSAYFLVLYELPFCGSLEHDRLSFDSTHHNAFYEKSLQQRVKAEDRCSSYYDGGIFNGFSNHCTVVCS